MDTLNTDILMGTTERLQALGVFVYRVRSLEMLPGSNTRRLLEPLPRALVNEIIDPLVSGSKELKKVDSPVFASLADTQQHQIITDATFS